MKTKRERILSPVLGDKKVLESSVAKYIHIKTPNIVDCSIHNFEEEEENLVQELLNSLLLTNDSNLLDVKIPVSYKVHNKLYEEVIIVGQQQVYIYNNHFINLKLHDSLRRISTTLIQLEISQCNLDNMSELICTQGNYLRMCTSLRYLNLSRNNLTDIPSCIIELNKNLQFLNLSGNKIGQFNADNLLRNLHEFIPASVLVLHLSGNPVHTMTSNISYRTSIISTFPALHILDGYLLLYREKYQHLNNLYSNFLFNYFFSDIKLPMHVYHIAYTHGVYSNNNNRIDSVLKMCQNISSRVNPIFVIHKNCKKYLSNKRYKVFTSNGVINRLQSNCRSFLLKCRLRNEMKLILQEQQQEHLLGYASGSLSMGILLKILHKFITRGVTRWRRRKSAIKIQLWYKKVYYKLHREREYYEKHGIQGVCVPIFHYDEALEILYSVVQRYNKKHNTNLAIDTDNVDDQTASKQNIIIRKLEHIGLCKVMITCKNKIARNYRYIPHRLSKLDNNSVASIDQMVKYANIKQWKQFVTIKRRPHRMKCEYYRGVKPLMRSLDKFGDAAIPLYLIQIPDQVLLQDYYRYLTKKQMVYVYHDQYVFKNIAATTIQKQFRNTRLRENMCKVLLPKLLISRAVVAIQRAWRFYRTIIRRLHFLEAVHNQVNSISSATLYMDSWLYYVAIRSQYLLPINTNCYPEFTGVPVVTAEGKAAFYSFHSNDVDNSSVVIPLSLDPGIFDGTNILSDEIDLDKLQQHYNYSLLDEGEYVSKKASRNRTGFPRWLCLSLPLAKNHNIIASRSTHSYGMYDILTTDVDVRLAPLQLDDNGTMFNVMKLQFSSIAEAKARCASLMLSSYSFYNHTSLKLLTDSQIEFYLMDKKSEISSQILSANPLQCIESCMHLESDIPHIVQSYDTSLQDSIRFRYMIECMKAEQFNQIIADEDMTREFTLSKQVELYTKNIPFIHAIDNYTSGNDSTSYDITQVGYNPVYDDLTRGSTKGYTVSKSEHTVTSNNNGVDGDDEKVSCSSEPEVASNEERVEIEKILSEILQRIENTNVITDFNSISVISMQENQSNSLEGSQIVYENHAASNIMSESIVLSLGSAPPVRLGTGGKRRPHTAPNHRRPVTPLATTVKNERTRVSTPVNFRSIRTSSLWSTERLLYWCSRNQLNDQGTASRLELLQYNMNRANSPLRSATPSLKDNRSTVKHDILDVDVSYNATSNITVSPSKSYLHLYLNRGSNANNTELVSDNIYPLSPPATANIGANTPKQSWKEKLCVEKKRSVEEYMQIETNLMKEYYLKKELDLVMKQKQVQSTKPVNIKVTIPISAPITLPFSIPMYTPPVQSANEVKEEIAANSSNHNTPKRESIHDLKNKKIKKQQEKEAADLVAAFMKHSNKANISLAKKYYNKKVLYIASKNKAKNARHPIDIQVGPSVPTLTQQTATDTFLHEQSSELFKIQNVTLSNYGINTMSSVMNDSIISDDETFQVKISNEPVNVENNMFKQVYMNDTVTFTRGESNTAPSPPTKTIPTRQRLRSSTGKRPNTSHMTPPTPMQRHYTPISIDPNISAYSVISEPTESIWKEVANSDRDHYRKIANETTRAATKKYNEKIIQIPKISYKF